MNIDVSLYDPLNCGAFRWSDQRLNSINDRSLILGSGDEVAFRKKERKHWFLGARNGRISQALPDQIYFESNFNSSSPEQQEHLEAELQFSHSWDQELWK
jgi:hypothetical protein